MPKKYPTSLGKLRVKQLSAKTLLDKFLDATADTAEAYYFEVSPEVEAERDLRFNVLKQEVRRRLNVYEVVRRAEAGEPRPTLDYYPDPPR